MKKLVSVMTLLSIIAQPVLQAATPVEALKRVGVEVIAKPGVVTEQYDWIQGENQNTVTDDLQFRLDRMPAEYEPDKKRNRYIVIPKVGAVAPFNNIYSGSNDYERIKFGKTFELNKYLINGVLRYPMTGHPGKEGNMLLFGHSSFLEIDPGYGANVGRYKTIFTTIMLLNSGDKIWIYTKRPEQTEYKKYEYIVQKSYETSASDVSVMYQRAMPELTLVGCSPIGTAKARWIVKAFLKGAPVIKDAPNFESPLDDNDRIPSTTDTLEEVIKAPLDEQSSATEDDQPLEASMEVAQQLLQNATTQADMTDTTVEVAEPVVEPEVKAERMPEPTAEADLISEVMLNTGQNNDLDESTVTIVKSENTVKATDFIPKELTSKDIRRLEENIEKIKALPVDSQERIKQKLDKYFIYVEYNLPNATKHAEFMQARLY